MKALLFALLLMWLKWLPAQELFPSSQPASNMSAKSFGLRLNNELYPAYDEPKDNAYLTNRTLYRLNPEFMWGINKQLMLHANLYASNVHQTSFKFEGGSLYLKYRFLSVDQVQTHFRMAAYAKASLIKNAIQYDEINLDGDNTGAGAGIIATQLLHRFALSVTAGYLRALNNIGYDLAPAQAKDGVNYSLSAGYLVLPVHYKNYNQPNLNLYVEFTGQWNPQTSETYLDIAPAAQLILNSVMRIDFIYSKQLYGNMLRADNTAFKLRFEYNFLNVYK